MDRRLIFGYRVERTHARVLEAQTVSDISALRVIHADGLFVAVARYLAEKSRREVQIDRNNFERLGPFFFVRFVHCQRQSHSLVIFAVTY